MNFGIYIGNLDPRSGGGYTFQESLLLQLNKIVTNHRFTIFYKGELPASLRETTLKDRKSTRLNSSHSQISYAVFCLKKKTQKNRKKQHESTIRSTHRRL